jgi:hypothetical protein
VPARWGAGVAFLPNGAGLNAADTGLTALIFGGVSGSAYLGDVVTYNFASGVMRTLVASLPAGSNTQPFARGYTEFTQLLRGQGANSAAALDSTIDSGIFYMIGGLGMCEGRIVHAAQRECGGTISDVSPRSRVTE